MRLFHFILLIIVSNNLISQACFTYDSAGNRIKRQLCMVSIPKEENEILAQVYGDIAYRTSVIDHDLSLLIIYPNPSTGVFRLKNQDQYFDNKIDLISMDGKLIEHLLISNDDIDLMHLPSGHYYIVLHAQGFRKSAKLILSK